MWKSFWATIRTLADHHSVRWFLSSCPAPNYCLINGHDRNHYRLITLCHACKIEIWLSLSEALYVKSILLQHALQQQLLQIFSRASTSVTPVTQDQFYSIYASQDHAIPFHSKFIFKASNINQNKSSVAIFIDKSFKSMQITGRCFATHRLFLCLEKYWLMAI